MRCVHWSAGLGNTIQENMHSLQFPDSGAHRPSILNFERQSLVEQPHPRQQVFRSRQKSLHRRLRGFAFGKHQSMKFFKKLGQSAPLAKIQCRPMGCAGLCQRVSRPHLNHIFEDVVDFWKARLGMLCYGPVQECDARDPVAINTNIYVGKNGGSPTHSYT